MAVGLHRAAFRPPTDWCKVVMHGQGVHRDGRGGLVLPSCGSNIFGPRSPSGALPTAPNEHYPQTRSESASAPVTTRTWPAARKKNRSSSSSAVPKSSDHQIRRRWLVPASVLALTATMLTQSTVCALAGVGRLLAILRVGDSSSLCCLLGLYLFIQSMNYLTAAASALKGVRLAPASHP